MSVSLDSFPSLKPVQIPPVKNLPVSCLEVQPWLLAFWKSSRVRGPRRLPVQNRSSPCIFPTSERVLSPLLDLVTLDQGPKPKAPAREREAALGEEGALTVLPVLQQTLHQGFTSAPLPVSPAVPVP